MLAAAANDFWRDLLSWLPFCSSILSLCFPREVFQELHLSLPRHYFSFLCEDTLQTVAQAGA